MDPVSLATLAVSGVASLAESGLTAAAAGVVGNAAHSLFLRTVEAARGRVRELYEDKDAHHVAQAVRRAQLGALQQVIRSYQSSDVSSAADRAFVVAALAFCKDGFAALRRDELLDIEITDALSQAIDSAIAQRADPENMQAQAKRLRGMCEEAVLAELGAEVAEREGLQTAEAELPDSFVAHFRGGGPASDSFWELFGGFIAGELGRKTEFYRIYTTGQMAEVKDAVRGIEVRFAPMLEQLHDVLTEMHMDLHHEIREVRNHLEAMDRSGALRWALPATIGDFVWDPADSFFHARWREMLRDWQKGGLDYDAGTATPEVPRKLAAWLCDMAEARADVDHAFVVASGLSRKEDEVGDVLRKRAFSEIERIYARIHQICVVSQVVEVRTAYGSEEGVLSDEAPVLAQADARPENADRLKQHFEERVEAAKKAELEEIEMRFAEWFEDNKRIRKRLAEILIRSRFPESALPPVLFGSNRALLFADHLIRMDIGNIRQASSDAARNLISDGLSLRLYRYVCPEGPPLYGEPQASVLYSQFVKTISRPFGSEEYVVDLTTPMVQRAKASIDGIPQLGDSRGEGRDIGQLKLPPGFNSHSRSEPNNLSGEDPAAERWGNQVATNRDSDREMLLEAFRRFMIREGKPQNSASGEDVFSDRMYLTQALQQAKSRARATLSRPAPYDWVQEFR